MRETFELLGNEIRAAGVGMLPAGVILTGGAAAARGRRGARPERAPDAGPRRRAGGHRRARRHAAQPVLQHRGRAPPVGRHQPHLGRAAALRVRAGRRRAGPHPRGPAERLPLGRARADAAAPGGAGPHRSLASRRPGASKEACRHPRGRRYTPTLSTGPRLCPRSHQGPADERIDACRGASGG